MAAVLAANFHGKGRVRIVKVVRRGEKHALLQFTVEINLEGPMETAFTQGNNSIIIPTDTQKNTVYVVAKRNNFESAEEFAVLIAKHFLDTYPQLVTFCRVIVKQDIWERVQVPDSRGVVKEHNHAFKKVGPHYTYARVEAPRGAPMRLWGGCKGYTLLKTTQSSFVDFHKDPYTSLPQATDRLMGSNFDSEWTYTPDTVAAAVSGRVNFVAVRDQILDTMTKTFAGPADVGVPSASVQVTLYQMGGAVLSIAPQVTDITLYMPNVHNMPFDLAKLGMSNTDHTGNIDILYPIDEPHGIIQATIVRPGAKL
eukprot:TRINITY_DN4367_c0_g2_i2.p1 TRINITY_DN4367_c0_g2~~TRINITY_DN4367_c0_g2_i2.p1  ORF type:complete len:311 (-),score=126.40 TRINITY_DN4367_c0_g2_i2:261-1193(-)